MSETRKCWLSMLLKFTAETIHQSIQCSKLKTVADYSKTWDRVYILFLITQTVNMQV